MVFPVPAWPERRMTPPTGKPPCNALSSRGIPVGERASAALDVAIPPSRLARFLNVSRGGAEGVEERVGRAARGGPACRQREYPRAAKESKISQGALRSKTSKTRPPPP